MCDPPEVQTEDSGELKVMNRKGEEDINNKYSYYYVRPEL